MRAFGVLALLAVVAAIAGCGEDSDPQEPFTNKAGDNVEAICLGLTPSELARALGVPHTRKAISNAAADRAMFAAFIHYLDEIAIAESVEAPDKKERQALRPVLATVCRLAWRDERDAREEARR